MLSNYLNSNCMSELSNSQQLKRNYENMFQVYAIRKVHYTRHFDLSRKHLEIPSQKIGYLQCNSLFF